MNANYERNEEYHRARYAFRCVDRVPESIRKKYHSYVSNSSALLHSAGLLQTISFYCSKGGSSRDAKHFDYLTIDLLSYTLNSDRAPSPVEERSGEQALALFRVLIDASEDTRWLMHYTEKTKMVVTWLQRFSKARAGNT